MSKKKVLLVGAGKMAVAYAKVLKAMDTPFSVLGRGEESAKVFEKETGSAVIRGGATKENLKQFSGTTTAIVSVSVESLCETTLLLIEHGFTSILVEKPAGLNREEITKIEKSAQKYNARILVAYNRRHYSSTQKAKEIIENDGGILSFTFDFTEWSDKIAPLPLHEKTKAHWVLANSSHVIDLAFFLGGIPKKIEAHVHGTLPWHPSGAIFSGSGVTENGALFSYHANWLSAGRWGVEIMTKNHKIILRPLEKLFIQKNGELEIQEIPLEDRLDVEYKPGVYKEVAEFLSQEKTTLPTITEHLNTFAFIEKIAKE